MAKTEAEQMRGGQGLEAASGDDSGAPKVMVQTGGD